VSSTTSLLVPVTRRVTLREAGVCPAPVELLARVRSAPGTVLMESASRGRPGGRRSLLVPGAAARLVLRGEVARVHALTPDGTRVLDALAARHPDARRLDDGGLALPVPRVARDPGRNDAERLRDDGPLDVVRALVATLGEEGPVGLDDLRVGAVPSGVFGLLAHDLVDRFETLPPRGPDPADDPDLHLVLGTDLVVWDHDAGLVQVVTRALGADPTRADAAHARHEGLLALMDEAPAAPPAPEPPRRATPPPAPARPDVSDTAFLAAVEAALEHVRAGEVFQVVLSRGLTMDGPEDPVAVYRALRRLDPSPYMFFVELTDGALIGASPETCVRVEDGRLELRPIAGTAPRGLAEDGTLDPELDARLAAALRLDPKEASEHAMLVDLARNDVARVSVPGTRCVLEPFALERYGHVQHLSTRVVGRLRPEIDALAAYAATANMGTLTGAPKLRAMEIIRELEPVGRGSYGGAVGYLLADGTFDSAIVIRSLRARGRVWRTRAGAGIVARSVPERELAEIGHKSRAARRAVAAALAEGTP